MQLEVLISCMNQTDLSIVEQSCLTGDVLIINQCDKDQELETIKGKQRIRMISTSQRGLSNSRNMAIQNAERDVCLLCDDDEIFIEGYEQIIKKKFRELPQADIIAFQIGNKVTRLRKAQRVGRIKSLKLASVQLAFRRSSIVENHIYFDSHMGAGSGNGCGEENKFLFDCIKKGLAIYFVPETIAVLTDHSSTWFQNYNETFFRQRGASTRYMMGLIFSVAYGFYYLFAKYPLYHENLSFFQAARALFGGILDNTISKQNRLEH